MRTEDLEELLAKFYDGKTDEQEEERLFAAFRHERELPARLQSEARLFNTWQQMQSCDVVCPSGLEERLVASIDHKAASDRFFLPSGHRLRRWMVAVAAVLLIVVGMGFFLTEVREGSSLPKDTFSDPDEAYRVLHATLMEVSVGLNSGMAHLSEVCMDINRMNKECLNELKE
ncbi:MAG: anti-sigma factor family protein [Bacteroides sp.]